MPSLTCSQTRAGQQEAAYADLTWTLLPDTRLTVGGRYSTTDEQVNGETFVNGKGFGQHYQKTHFQQPTWRAILDHKFTPDTMVYLSASSGFNEGQYNSTNPAAKELFRLHRP